MQNTKQKANRKFSWNRIHRSNWRAWRWSNTLITLITLVTNYETGRCVSWVESFCGRITSKPKTFEFKGVRSLPKSIVQTQENWESQFEMVWLTKLVTGNWRLEITNFQLQLIIVASNQIRIDFGALKIFRINFKTRRRITSDCFRLSSRLAPAGL